MAPRKPAAYDYHPVQCTEGEGPPPDRTPGLRFRVPADVEQAEVEIRGRVVRLTNLNKLFWPGLGITKRDLLQYYADMADVILPHVRDRAMVMKRYPNGADGDFFFMKRAPKPHPPWLSLCTIDHLSGNVIDFPMVQDLATLLWVVNLGCIDLNEWYARCDDVDRPDYLHFDLDPVPDAGYGQVLDVALILHEALDALGMPNYAKTTGSRGIHVYVPIVRSPNQREVWTFAKAFAQALAARHPELITAVYKVAARPPNRILVDYNQNAWGRTLASVYSVRPRPLATVSTPVTWEEVARRVKIEDFTLRNVPDRVREVGDLWAPVCFESPNRFRLESVL